jgi:formylglycine-generating enzyme required for sulfatase activity
VKTGFADKPVNFVTFYDSLRFANWLENGQPTGAQGNATTEDGAYTITSAGILANSITRNAGATIFLTSEDEWYKAAYYDAALPGYYAYPAGADVATTCAAPGATPNTANCGSLVGTLTDVGAYTGSPSPSGTFDQGGNVYEWNETGFELVPSATTIGIRGGDSVDSADATAASSRGGNQEPTSELDFVGFRVAAVPEPGPLLLALTGALVLSAARRRA